MRKSNRKEKVGIVISDKMDKTIGVRVERTTRHPLYGKIMRKSTTFKAHDEKNEAKTGDRVRIKEARPLSKTKRWQLIEVVEKAREQGELQ